MTPSMILGRATVALVLIAATMVPVSAKAGQNTSTVTGVTPWLMGGYSHVVVDTASGWRLYFVSSAAGGQSMMQVLLAALLSGRQVVFNYSNSDDSIGGSPARLINWAKIQ